MKYLIERDRENGRNYEIHTDTPVPEGARSDAEAVDGVAGAFVSPSSRYVLRVGVGRCFDADAVVAAVVARLADRAGTTAEPYQTPEPRSGLNHEWGVVGELTELASVKRELAASGNYVADREVDPTCVWFRNGRKVSLRTEVKGGRIVRAWLDVSWAGTADLQEAEGDSMLPEGD